MVLAARTHCELGEAARAGQVAASALEAATDAGDAWAMGWALHVLTIVTAVQGRMASALPLFDQALAVTASDPALTDLRLLLQLNQAIALGKLDQYEQALAVAGQAKNLVGQVGTTLRLEQAHSALGQLLFETGRWDDALAEVTAMDEDLKEPGGACCDLGIAAAVCFHRGETGVARQYLVAAAPYARLIGRRVIGPLALARSLDREQDGALPEALAVLTDVFSGDTEELGEIEDLLADAVRLALKAGDLATARGFVTRPPPSPPGRKSRTGRRTRCTVAACSTTTPSGCWRRPNATPTSAGRWRRRRRWRRPPGNPPTPAAVTRPGPRSPVPWRPTAPWARRGHRPAARRTAVTNHFSRWSSDQKSTNSW